MDGYRIATLCFNNESIALCESLDEEVVRNHRSSMTTGWRYECTIADYMEPYLQRIKDMLKSDPEVLIFADQESRSPGSYAHSDLLPGLLVPRGYRLLKRTKMMGVGVTTYKGALSGDPSARGLRTSIYVKSHLYDDTVLEEKDIRDLVSYDSQHNVLCDSLFRGKGATVSYVKLPGVETLAIINCHLPFNAKSLIRERRDKNKMIRQTQLNASNLCFNYIFETAVVNSTVRPRHVIFTGDLNYRVNAPVLADIFIKEMIQKQSLEHIRQVYLKYDELYQQMEKGNIYSLEEGVDDSGPVFYPTCKMIKGRPRNLSDPVDDLKVPDLGDASQNEIYGYQRMNAKNIVEVGPYLEKPIIREKRGDVEFNLGKRYQRIPSWCDRILHTNWNYYSLETADDEYDDTEVVDLTEISEEEAEKIAANNIVDTNKGYWGWGVESVAKMGGYVYGSGQDKSASDKIAKESLRKIKSDLSCLHYGRFDQGQAMNKSDHAAVFSIHELRAV